jgi:hypothetical protein
VSTRSPSISTMTGATLLPPRRGGRGQHDTVIIISFPLVGSIGTSISLSVCLTPFLGRCTASIRTSSHASSVYSTELRNSGLARMWASMGEVYVVPLYGKSLASMKHTSLTSPPGARAWRCSCSAAASIALLSFTVSP